MNLTSRFLLDSIRLLKDYPVIPGYNINIYRHSLQMATIFFDLGKTKEEVVASLFHDIGFYLNRYKHGALIADILKKYIKYSLYWTLCYHESVWSFISQGISDVKVIREILAGTFMPEKSSKEQEDIIVYAIDFAKYDDRCIDATFNEKPLSFFEDIVNYVIV